jgi:hypothetical protein
MKKKLLYLFICLYIPVGGFTQQLVGPLNINNIGENIVFFDRQTLNPSFVNDTSRFYAGFVFHEQWVGMSNSPSDKTFSMNGRTPVLNSTIGFNSRFFSFSTFNYETYSLNFRNSFLVNNRSGISLGINVKYSRLKFSANIPGIVEYPVIAYNSDWTHTFDIDFGLTFSYLNHNIGLSIQNFLASKPGTNHTFQDLLNQESYILNYFPVFRISKSVNLLPEVIFIRMYNSNSYIINAKVNLWNWFNAGLIYDDRYDKSYGLMLSVFIFRYFEMGYASVLSSSSRTSTTGFHSFKLGVIIK